MVLNCVAYKCHNVHYTNKAISFHTFPFKRPEILKLWIRAIRREYWNPSKTSRLCGEHFLPSDYQDIPGSKRKILKIDAIPSVFSFPKHLKKLPNDMENYMRYHVMGSVSQVRMKSGCIPTKFTCQPDRKTRTSDTIERPYICKKRKMMAFEECMVTEYTDLEEIGSRSPVSPNKEENMHFGDLEYLTKSESEQCDTSSNLIQDNVEIKEEPLLEIKEEPLVDIKEEPLVEIKEEPLVDIKEELLVEIKNEPLVKIKEEPLVEIKEEPLVEIKIEQND